jgi:hypothetical protein
VGLENPFWQKNRIHGIVSFLFLQNNAGDIIQEDLESILGTEVRFSDLAWWFSSFPPDKWSNSALK